MLDRISRIGRTTVAWLSRGTILHTGGLSGVFLVLWWTHALTACGGTLTIMSGLVTAATLGAAWGWCAGGLPLTGAALGTRWIMMSVWTVVLPLLSHTFFAGLQFVSVESISQPWSEYLTALAAGAILLGVPHYCLAGIVVWQVQPLAVPASPRSGDPSWFCLGLTLLLAPTALLSTLGVAWITVAAVSISLLWGVNCIWRVNSNKADAESRRLSANSARPVPPAGGHLMLLNLLPPVAAGGLMATATQLTAQMWFNSLHTLFASAGGAIVGLAMVRRGIRGGRPVSMFAAVQSNAVGLFAAAFACLLVGSFGRLTDMSLWINGAVSSTASVMGLRTLMAAILAVPAGVVLGWSLGTTPSGSLRPRSSVLLLTAVLGWSIARWSCPSPASSATMVAAIGLLHSIAIWIRAEFPRPVRRLSQVATISLLAVCATAPWSLRQFDPGRSARLLFSARTALAAQTSSNHDLLNALDDSRLLQTIVGTDAAWTQWRHRGAMLTFRENGQPQGEISSDLSTAPEAPAELLAGALPLLIHPRADDVLVVGLGSAAVVRSGLECPVQSLTCWEQDADLIELVRSTVRGPETEFLDDPRLRIQRVLPVIASAARNKQAFDIIILNERQLSSWRTLGRHHLQAYRRWHGLLKPDGLLCQRLEYVNLGPGPLVDLTRTLSTLFPQVILWESAPGELLLLASTQEQPLINAGLLARFDTPQSRRLFGRIGWDYSHPLNIVTVEGSELLESASEGGAIATSANAHFEYTLPVESLRWGSKSGEMHQLLVPVAHSALARIPAAKGIEDVQKRLEDIVEQRQLITRFPDHYWAYRKTLRDRLQERPRSVIVQMKHELHPEDERRREYLKSLGAAATAKSPTPRQLAAVEEFSEPFDPLVSPFLHRELAQLWTRCTPQVPAAELQHWLRSVYYSPGYDRSIRDATAALSLLLQHPESIPDAARRWDQTNSLLEILKERWTLRSQQQAASRFESADVSETMEVTQRALGELVAGAGAAGIDADWAATRVRVLERTFVRALRSHYASQVAHQKSQQRQQTAREASIKARTQ